MTKTVLTYPNCPFGCLNNSDGKCKYTEVCESYVSVPENMSLDEAQEQNKLIKLKKPSHYIVDMQEHGYWKIKFVCSNCGTEVDKELKECPHCHSKMDK